jgi:hypothetical protein
VFGRYDIVNEPDLRDPVGAGLAVVALAQLHVQRVERRCVHRLPIPLSRSSNTAHIH